MTGEWFGDWPTPRPPVAEDPADEIPVPVGATCLQCEEEFEAVGLKSRGILYADGQPVHLVCSLRSTVGSLAHLQGRCSCFGGDDADPEGMTRYEASVAAYEWFTRYGLGPTPPETP